MDSNFINKARALISVIEEHIGFVYIDNNPLFVKDLLGSSSPIIDTFENAALSLAYFLDERKKDAEALLLNIEKYMGRESCSGLIKNKIDSQNVFASDNLILAINYSLWGNQEKAERQISSVETYIGFELKNEGKIGLLKNGINREEIYAFNSLLLAISYRVVGRKSDAKLVFKEIISHFKFDPQTGLMEGNVGRKNYKDVSYFTFDNSLLSIYFMLSGEKERSRRLILSVEKYIDYHPSGLIKRSTRDERPYTYVNTIFAIAYQALGGNIEKMLKS